ncbi:Transposon Ty3-G Gag-Pol polyprotein, partial [Nosema granulosis]
ECTGPLYDLLKGEKKNSSKRIEMTEEQLRSFQITKEKICKSAIRAQPCFDREFILTTDASDTGIGAVLSQKDENGKERMISAFSKRLDKCQKNYSVTDKELLGLVKGIENYRHYLLGRPFTLRTDHRALTYLWETKNPVGRLLRWSLKLSEYDFRVEYIKGDDNIADGFSRVYQDEEKVCAAVREELTEEMKQEILKSYHDFSCHGSVNTMKFMLKQRYRWKNMYKDIEEFHAKCNVCIRTGGERINTKNKVIMTEQPNQLWEVDLLGKIFDEESSKYIFVAIDHYTKWVETRVIERKIAQAIKQAIEELIIKKHGIPTRILSDMGLEFNNQEVRSLQEKYGFKWEFGSPYHHQTTGAVERVNQTLLNGLKKVSNFGRLEWTPHVPQVTLAYNLAFNRALGTSPYIFKNGTQLELEVDKSNNSTARKYSRQDLIKQREINFKKYAKSIIKGKIELKQNLQIGDKVLIFRDTIKDKLCEKWWPGYIVTDTI